jgi:hypothetical protein
MASAYQGAVEAVVAMVLSALAGYWLDSRLGSGPIGLFAGMAIGFAALVLRLLRIRTPSMGRATSDPAEQDASGSEAPPAPPGGGDAPPAPDADDDTSWTQVLAPHRDLDDDEDPGGPQRS